MNDRMAVEQVLTTTGELLPEVVQTPEELLQSAKEAAQALERVIQSNDRPPVMFAGRRYLEFPHWQTIASFFRCSVMTEGAEPVEINGVKGFKAKAKVINEKTGMIVGSAEAYCLQDEPNWAKKPMFQLASMAQTRAGAKSLANKFRYVAIVAGYEGTPREELPDEITKTERQVSMPKAKEKPVEKTIPTGLEAYPADVPELPPVSGSKLLPKLYETVRKIGIPEEEMKKIIKVSYGKESSKELTDGEVAALIRSVEKGRIR